MSCIFSFGLGLFVGGFIGIVVGLKLAISIAEDNTKKMLDELKEGSD